jgi:hypothetical protein
MRNRVASLLAVLLVSAAAACAAGAGRSVELRGKLLLRGNAPFVYVVVLSGDGVWKLDGVPLTQACALQNQQVDVHGTVVRERPAGAELPAVQVRSLTLAPP